MVTYLPSSLTQDNPTSDGDLYINGNVTVYSTLTTGKCDDFVIEGNLTCDNLTFWLMGFWMSAVTSHPVI